MEERLARLVALIKKRWIGGLGGLGLWLVSIWLTFKDDSLWSLLLAMLAAWVLASYFAGDFLAFGFCETSHFHPSLSTFGFLGSFWLGVLALIATLNVVLGTEMLVWLGLLVLVGIITAFWYTRSKLPAELNEWSENSEGGGVQ